MGQLDGDRDGQHGQGLTYGAEQWMKAGQTPPTGVIPPVHSNIVAAAAWQFQLLILFNE